jgi:hypothetical protein
LQQERFSFFASADKLIDATLSGESVSVDTNTSQNYPREFCEIVKFPKKFNFQCRWNRSVLAVYANSYFFGGKERSTMGFKATKQHLTHLQGENISWDFTQKPLIIYHLWMPHAICGYGKRHRNTFYLTTMLTAKITYSISDILIKCEYAAFMKNWKTWPVPLHPPQIPHRLAWN